jgi:uncharacterized membrane protein YbhN (UPF0104 family)
MDSGASSVCSAKPGHPLTAVGPREGERLTAGGPGLKRPRRFSRYAKTILVIALFIVALRALQNVVTHYQWGDLIRYLGTLPAGQIVEAVVLTFAGYVVMTAYDTVAFRYINRSLLYRHVALASFTAYAINNSLGLSGIVGTTLRYRFYRNWGVRGAEIATVFVFCTVTYWLGFVLLGGCVFLLQPPAIPSSVHLPFPSLRILGTALLLMGIAYFLIAVIRGRPLRLRGWEIALPKPSMFVAQVMISMADWLIAGAVFHTLLPKTVPISFGRALSLFLLAQTGGLVSNVPGGLGVFEAIALTLLRPYAPTPVIFSALVAFRGIYFLLPLIMALALLASHSLTERAIRACGRVSERKRP